MRRDAGLFTGGAGKSQSGRVMSTAGRADRREATPADAMPAEERPGGCAVGAD